MNSFAIEPVFGSLWPTIAIALMGFFLLAAVRPANRQMQGKRLPILMLVRTAALLLFLLALIRPSIIRTDSRPATAALAVLADSSRSMTLTDGEGQSRWETQRQVLNQLAPALQKLDSELDVRFYEYGDKANEISSSGIDAFLQTSPEKPQTDLALALRTALAGASGRPLSGVVMIGDGTSTVADSNPSSVARTLGSLDVPLWTVPIGPPLGDSQARDVAVEQLPESFKVFSKNLFRVAAMVTSKGMLGRDIPVTITLVDSENKREDVATRILVPNSPDDSLALDIELVAPAPGNYRLEVKADPQDGEALTDNNIQIAFLDVREGGGRIFYLEGAPRMEQLFLRRALTESPDLEVTLQIAPEAERSWPIDLGQAIQPGQYDVFILGDVDAQALGEKNLKAIAELVDKGAGLLMLGGERSFDLGGYATTRLADVLPIQLDRQKRVRGNGPLPQGAMHKTPVTLRVRRPSPITRFGTSGETNQIWKGLKPLLGANKFLAPKVSPNVEVVLESEQGEPMLVLGDYGTGRTAAFAGDTTWQWWRQGKDEIHRRFWRQMILWLLARDAVQLDAVWLKMDTRRFNRESPPSFTAGIQTLGSADDLPSLSAEIIDENGVATPIALVTTPPTASNQDGGDLQFSDTTPMVSGLIPDLPGGLYRLRCEAAGDKGQLKPAEMLFQVVEMDAELSRPLAEVARLQQLAALTEAAGGRAFRPDEVDRLLVVIQQLRKQASLPIIEKHRLGEGPIGGWLLMLGFTTLLCAEWYLRKMWGLT